jgi:hypothetical protein
MRASCLRYATYPGISAIRNGDPATDPSIAVRAGAVRADLLGDHRAGNVGALLADAVRPTSSITISARPTPRKVYSTR